MFGAIKSMETIQKMERVKWVHVVFLFTINLGLGSGHSILSEKDQGVYEPNNFGFQLGGTWSVPFLGNIGGSLGFGSDSSGNLVPQFGFGGGGNIGGFDGHPGFSLGGGGTFGGGIDGRSGFSFSGSGGFGGGTDGHSGFSLGGGGGGFGGGANGHPGFGGGGGGFSLGTGGGGSGGFESANIGSSGCNCDFHRSDGVLITSEDGSNSGGGSSTKTRLGNGPNLGNDGGDGDNNDKQNIKIIESLTCRPINCPRHGDCGGYGGLPYWCDVPGFGVYPFACPGDLDKLSRSSHCIPLACPPGAACQYGYPSPHSLFWINDHSNLENGAGKSQKAK